jgi:hypothetical protein
MVVFAEVEEFLNGALSRMTKEQWERLPSWAAWKNGENGLNWSIGSVSMFEGPTGESAEQRKAMEAAWGA